VAQITQVRFVRQFPDSIIDRADDVRPSTSRRTISFSG
jgi:hypothetical protein